VRFFHRLDLVEFPQILKTLADFVFLAWALGQSYIFSLLKMVVVF
jgi:hypothetical protein